eukprot:CAMPEP_0197035670 /NCGR_PEP_ID=MMETSP1384-20130603/13403_1 /TAXON_ID=29189 /ORGANISM="Ammonia sp." /LENGTH=311 /DNA_ID=CAMNT_0042465761 /DNA_START=46 /DNA_END=981 /DNA_ORIENTATION=-
MEEDDFYALRTAYYIGDFDKVEREYKNLSHSTGMKAKERDSLYCRSLVAQHRFKEATKIARGEASAIVAVKQLIVYKQATSDEAKEMVIDKLKEYLKESSYLENTAFCVVTAEIFIEHAMYREALELVTSSHGKSSSDGNLEKLLQETHIYLRIGRPDLAQKALQRMQELEDDDAITQMANISLCLFHGGAQKVQDGVELIEDLMNANAATIQLINMQCVANMHLKNWSEAWKLCKRSRDLAKELQANNKSFELSTATLINSITCLRNLNKGHEIVPKLFEQLKRINPNHPFLLENDRMSALFDKSAKNFK